MFEFIEILGITYPIDANNFNDKIADNILALKKLSDTNGKQYTVLSDKKIKYHFREHLHRYFGWQLMPLELVNEGSKDKDVIQASRFIDIVRYEEANVFGYLNLNRNISRVHVFSVSPAISLQEYMRDVHFYTNMGIAQRYNIEHRSNKSLQSIYEKESHNTRYRVKYSIDLRRFGFQRTIYSVIEGEQDDNTGNKKKSKIRGFTLKEWEEIQKYISKDVVTKEEVKENCKWLEDYGYWKIIEDSEKYADNSSKSGDKNEVIKWGAIKKGEKRIGYAGQILISEKKIEKGKKSKKSKENTENIEDTKNMKNIERIYEVFYILTDKERNRQISDLLYTILVNAPTLRGSGIHSSMDLESASILLTNYGGVPVELNIPNDLGKAYVETIEKMEDAQNIKPTCSDFTERRDKYVVYQDVLEKMGIKEESNGVFQN